MEKRIQRVVEKPNGHGEIYKDGKRLAGVYYSLLVKQEFIITETPKGKVEIPRGMVIIGEVAIDRKERGQVELMKDINAGGLLSLHLSDGRRWESITPQGNPVAGTFRLISRISDGLVKEK